MKAEMAKPEEEVDQMAPEAWGVRFLCFQVIT